MTLFYQIIARRIAHPENLTLTGNKNNHTRIKIDTLIVTATHQSILINQQEFNSDLLQQLSCSQSYFRPLYNLLYVEI